MPSSYWIPLSFIQHCKHFPQEFLKSLEEMFHQYYIHYDIYYREYIIWYYNMRKSPYKCNPQLFVIGY